MESNILDNTLEWTSNFLLINYAHILINKLIDQYSHLLLPLIN